MTPVVAVAAAAESVMSVVVVVAGGNVLSPEPIVCDFRYQ